MSHIDQQQLRTDVIEILSNLVGIGAEKITDQDRLREDLGLDSLQSMELLSRVSDQYELDLEVEDVMDVETVGDVIHQLVEYIQANIPN